MSFHAAIKKYHSLGSLNNRNLFLTVLEPGRPKIKILGYSVPCSWLGDGHILLVSSHGLSSVYACGGRQRDRERSLPLLIRPLNPSWESSHIEVISTELPPKASSPHMIILGIKTMNWKGAQIFIHLFSTYFLKIIYKSSFISPISLNYNLCKN